MSFPRKRESTRWIPDQVGDENYPAATDRPTTPKVTGNDVAKPDTITVPGQAPVLKISAGKTVAIPPGTKMIRLQYDKPQEGKSLNEVVFRRG